MNATIEMHHLRNYTVGGVDRYSAKKASIPVNFVFIEANAKSVALVGDFNGWDGAVNPMRQAIDGAWKGQVSLSHGHHHYMFLVDGKLVLDPRASGIARNGRNERVSMISVS